MKKKKKKMEKEKEKPEQVEKPSFPPAKYDDPAHKDFGKDIQPQPQTQEQKLSAFDKVVKAVKSAREKIVRDKKIIKK